METNTDRISPSDPTETAAELRLAVVRVARKLRQESVKPGGERILTPSLTSALGAIERWGPLAPSELADIEVIARPSATQLLAKLESEGMIERQSDPEDGRRALFTATRAGRERLGRVRRRKNANLARKLGALPAEDLETLRRAAEILDRMIDAEREKP